MGAEQQYVYTLKLMREDLMTDDPAAWSHKDSQVIREHFEYLRAAHAAGTVILAGRSTDFEGPAVVIFKARSESDARAFMESDPAVAQGLMTASLHPFRVALGH